MANPSFTQVAFRIRNDDGSETGATWRQAQNTNDTVAVNGNVRVRFLVDETASVAWTNRTWNIRYSLNGGAYTLVTGTTPIQVALSANFADGDDTTSQLTGGTGTFVTNNNGMKEATGGAINSGTAGQFFELEWCLYIDNEQVANNNTIALRVYDGNTALATYSQTPTLTVSDPAVSVAHRAYRFYNDGTESGSTAVANEDTNITADLSGGDYNSLVRIGLQESGGGFGDSTDDYFLWYSHANKSFVPVGSTGSTGTVDEYDRANRDTGLTTNAATFSTAYRGQAFIGNGAFIDTAEFALNRVGTSTSNTTAILYNATGTYGTNAVPTGSAIATSNTVAFDDISNDGTYPWQSYTFPNRVYLESGKVYVIVFRTLGGNSTNYIQVGADSSTPTHGGNSSSSQTIIAWNSSATTDLIFRVTSIAHDNIVRGFNSSNLTEGAATTQRLSSGTGSFQAGRVAEDGDVENFKINPSVFTEMLYSVTVEKDFVATSDTIRFRVYRNGNAITVPTSSGVPVYPTITVSIPSATTTDPMFMMFL